MFLKAFFFLVVSVLFGGCATLDYKPDPIVGVWDYELFNLPQGEPIGFFTISKSDEGYSMVLTSPKADMDVEEVSIEGDAIVGGYFASQGYTIDVRGKFEANSFEGKIDAEGNVFRMTATKRE